MSAYKERCSLLGAGRRGRRKWGGIKSNARLGAKGAKTCRTHGTRLNFKFRDGSLMEGEMEGEIVYVCVPVTLLKINLPQEPEL